MNKRLFVLLLVSAALLSMLPLAHAGLGGPGEESPPDPPVVLPQSLGEIPPETIQKSEPVGYQRLTSEVTPEGGLRVHMPLDVPVGLAAPSLSIELASGGGNDLLGVGGSLGGLSEIQPCGQVYSIDGQVTPADFSSESRFCLDGQRLIVVSGKYGEEGSEYRLEPDTFTRLVFHHADPLKPGWFEVFAKSGSISEYIGIQVHRAEPSAASPYALSPIEPVTIAYVLSEVKDRAGNKALYHYKTIKFPELPDLFSIEYMPESIEYTLRDGRKQEAAREVRFEYEPRPDPSFAFLAGVRIKSTQRLKAIELYAPNPYKKELVGQYSFTYVMSAGTHRSLLNTASRCDAEGVCLWDKKFQWETSVRPDFLDPIDLGWEFPDIHFVQARDTGPIVYDADNDGKDDLLYRRGAEYVLRRAGQDGTPLGERVVIDPVDSAGGNVVGFESIKLEQSRAIDVDGSGKPKVFAAQILIDAQKNKLIPLYHIFQWDALTGGLVSTGTFIDAELDGQGNGDPYLGPIDFGDTTGSGLPDLFFQHFVTLTHPVWWLFKNDGFGAFGSVVDTGADGYCGRRARILDRDGDGKAEIWSGSNIACTQSAILGFDGAGQPTIETQTGLGVDTNRTLLADLNGDGYRDLLKPQPGGGWVRFSTGVGFGPKEDMVNGPVPDGNVNEEMDQGMAVTDINGDGREDVLAFHFSPAPMIVAHLSQGDGSFDPVTFNTWPGWLQAIEGFTTSRTGDFNGDGLMDIVKIDQDGHMRVLLQKPGHVDVIHALWDSPVAEHPREIFEYSNAWSDHPKPATCSYPQRCIRHGFPVVREHKQWQGEDVGQYRTTQYSYEDPRVDLRGRGFLGFGEVRIWDVDRKSETTITFDHETRFETIYPYAGLPKTIREVVPIWEKAPASFPAAAMARVTQIDNVYQLEMQNLLKTHWTHPSSWASREWDQKVDVRADGIDVPSVGRPPILRRRQGKTEVDDYGNVKVAEEETLGGVYRRVETDYFDPDPATWLIGLPKSTRVLSAKSKAGPLPEPRRTAFTYDARGLLRTIEVEPTSPDPNQKKTTTLARNLNGLVSQVTEEAPGVAPRHVSIAYDDPEHMFPTSVWNDLGFTESFVYHPAFGVLATSTDINGVMTRRHYDGFMRLRRVETDGDGGVDLWEEPFVEDGWVRGLVERSASDAGGESYAVVNEIGRTIEQGTRAFDGQWSRVAAGFDLLGRPTLETRPALGAISPDKTMWRFDSLDRLLEAKGPDGATTTYKHSFLKTWSWDPRQHESFVVRDLDDRVVVSANVLNGNAITTSYAYGDFGQLESVVDVQGNKTALEYDQRGRRTLLIDPDRGQVRSQFNGLDDLVWEDNDLSQKNSLGKAISYFYDPIGRLDHKEDTDGVTAYIYDQGQGALGQLTEATSPDGTKTTLAYDFLGRPQTTTWLVNGHEYAVDTHFDALGRLERVEYPDVPGRPGPRFAVDYKYNPTDYLESIEDAAQGKAFWTVKGRNADGALTTAEYGNGLVNLRTYYPLTGRLNVNELGASMIPLDELKQTYYPDGTVHERIEPGRQRTETFAYDSLKRLTSWTVKSDAGTRTTAYGFDDIGNLTTVKVNQALTEVNTYGLDGKPHALSTTLLGDHIPDAIGRRVQGGGRTIAYTAFDLPREITPEGSGPTAKFRYDAFQQRVQKVTNTGSTIFIADLYERREELNGAVEHVFFVPGEDGPAAEVHYKEGAAADTRLFLHEDALGSIRLVTDDAGSPVADPMYYEPFGQRVQEDGSPIPQNYSPPVKLGFTGQRHDDELGLIHMRGRAYDPVTRQFLTPDPSVAFPLFSQSYNRFAYALNNPLNFRDPSGFDPTPVGCGEKHDCISAKAPNFGSERPTFKKAGGGGASKAGPSSAAPKPATPKADAQESSSETLTLGSPAASPPYKPAPEIEPPQGPLVDDSEIVIGRSGLPEPRDSSGTLSPESWKDSDLVQGTAGLAYGTGQALAPGGVFAPSPRPKDPAFEFWRGAGQFAMGAVELFKGFGLLGGGGAAAVGGLLGSVPTGGAGLLLTVGGASVAGVGVAAIAQGAMGIYAGIQTMAGSTSLSTGGGSGSSSSDEGGGRRISNPAQDKRLTNGEIKRLEGAGYTAHSLKPKNYGSKFDLFKRPDGEIVIKPKDGSGPGEPVGVNINDIE